jgi:adenylate kinase
MAYKLGADPGRIRAVVLIGAPAAGKDTQTRRLVERYGWPDIITSRDLVLPTTNGDLCPCEQVCEELAKRLANIPSEQTFILNGMPRTDVQVCCLGKILKARYGHDWQGRTKLIEFVVSFESGWKRLEAANDRGGRPDDDYEIYCKRYQGHVGRLPLVKEALSTIGLPVEYIDTDTYNTADSTYWELSRRLGLYRDPVLRRA